MYEQYTRLSDLVVNVTLFEFLYVEAAQEAASIFQFRYEPDPQSLEWAHIKFVRSWNAHNPLMANLNSWERKVGLAINILVRAAAEYQIIVYKGRQFVEGVSPAGEPTSTPIFHSKMVRENTNSLVALAFGVKILAMEVSIYLQSRGYYAANIDALTSITTPYLARYVALIEKDRKQNFGSSRLVRRDLRVTWYLRHLLMKNLPSRG